MSSSILTAENLGDRLNDVLTDFFVHQRQVMNDISPQSAPMVRSIESLMDNGKRLRAAFCYWGWRGAGGAADDPTIIRVAAALELFHTALLIHDDITDNADTRRGQMSVHRRFAAHHYQELGDQASHEMGCSCALLTGDLCLAMADELFHNQPPADPADPSATSAPSGSRVAQARAHFNRMRCEVAAGQFLDITAAHRPLDDPNAHDHAMHVIELKTARYSVQGPLLIGGALAGSNPDLLDMYREYGNAVGMAFQLRDDILGIFGDSEITGKPTGDDIREGKRTLLLARTFAHASEEQRDLLRIHVGRSDVTAHEIADIQDIMTATGAVEHTENTITTLANRARELVINSGLHTAASHHAAAGQALLDLVDAATARAA